VVLDLLAIAKVELLVEEERVVRVGRAALKLGGPLRSPASRLIRLGGA
jgi:hypothetical protein